LTTLVGRGHEGRDYNALRRPRIQTGPAIARSNRRIAVCIEEPMRRTRALHAQEIVLLSRRRAAAAEPMPMRQTQPTVTVVLLTLDRLHLTRRCVESIYAHADYPFDLLIHDDGSQPDTLDYLRWLRDARGNVELFESRERMGCAKARNRAFEQVDSQYVFSLDNDIVCHPGWLREAMACAARHDAAFVSPLRLEPDGRLWSFAPELVHSADGAVLEIARWFHDLPLDSVQAWFAEADVATNFVCGGAGLFSRAAFRECGGFADGYGVGFEDLDFSLQMSARGHCAWATARAVLTHDDLWQPQSEADVRYAQRRYDMGALRAAAALFKRRWGVEVLPDKYVDSLQRRLSSKLGDGS
jgi:GT2 family glycosyltransferase